MTTTAYPTTAFDTITTALESRGRQLVREGANRGRTSCPAHHGQGPNLLVTNTETRVLLKCFSQGCDGADILDAIGLTVSDRYHQRSTAYRYVNQSGALLRTVTRSTTPDGKKTFRQNVKHPDVTLYRLPEVLAAVKAGTPVYLVEGEEDVHALQSVGAVATTAPQGASNFGKVDVTPLCGADVRAIADRDDAGVRWARQVADKLTDTCSLTWLAPKEGKDASDHVAAGYGLDDLLTVAGPVAAARVDDGRQDQLWPLRKASVTWACDIAAQPVSWLWEDDGAGRLPMASLITAAGREGTGKSSFGIWLAAQVTRGSLPGQCLGTPRTVLYVAFEDSWAHTLRPRLEAAGADLTKVGRLDLADIDGSECAWSLPADNAELERVITDKSAALVIVDPLMSAVSGKLDSHNSREMRTALDPLAKIADSTGAVILGIAHFNKSASTDVSSLITGAGAWKDVPRAILGFARDDAGRVMTQSKNSLGIDALPSLAYEIREATVTTTQGPALTARFEFIGTSDRTVAEVLRSSRDDPEEPDERAEVDRWLEDVLRKAGGSQDAGAVFRSGHQAGFSKDQLKRSKKRLGIEASKTAFSAGWAWTLPAATPEDHEGSAHHAEGSEGSEGSKPPSEPLPSALPSPRDNSAPPQAGKGADVAVLPDDTPEDPETRREHPREHTSRASAPFAPFAPFAPLGGQALPSQTPTCRLHPDRPRPDACYTCEQAANADASQYDDHDTMPLFDMPARPNQHTR